MKKDSTQTTQPMDTLTISRRHVARGPRKEVVQALRHFARSYCPMPGCSMPGFVLN